MSPKTERPLRVGTRGSALALAQSARIVDLLGEAAPGALDVEIVTIKTSGDRHRDRPFEAIGPKGIFARDIQHAVLAGEVDVAVHSLKDLPALEPDGLMIAAVPERSEARDALVTADGRTLDDLPPRARIGTSSSRRGALLHALRPDLDVVPLRGNVDTRLGKVSAGDVDAAVLAGAGLLRLGRPDAVAEWLDPVSFVPPPGQGALGIEARTDRVMGDLAWVTSLEHVASRSAVDAERVFMRVCEGGCEVPLGAWARWDGDLLRCTGFLATPAGDVHFRGEVAGDDPEQVGVALASRILEQGGSDLLDRVRGD